MDTKQCSFDEEKIIDVAYRDAAIGDRLQVFLHTKKCTECNSLYREYKQTAERFNEIKKQQCPSSVTVRVENRIGYRNKDNSKLFDRMLDIVFYRPAYVLPGSAVVVILMIFLTVKLFNIVMHEPEQVYTEAEIHKAQEEIEMTFAMIAPVVYNAQRDILDKIIMSQIVPPVRQSVETTNQLFIKGIQQQ